MIAPASPLPSPALPRRPAPVRLPEGPPFGFVLQELAARHGTDAYPVKYALHDLRAWIARRDPSQPLARPAREEADWDSHLGGLRMALREVGTLLRRQPAPETARVLSELCESAAVWAERHGAPWTAVAFAQAASDLLPEEPAPACLLGRLAREVAPGKEVWRWLRWARRTASLHDETPTHARALLLSGLLCLDHGEPRCAESLLVAASTLAAEACAHDVEGDAQAALALLCYGQGRASIGASHALVAVLALGARSASLVEFATDLLWVWTSAALYGSAAVLSVYLAPVVTDPVRRALVHALGCRTLAAAQDDPGQERAWNEAWAALGAAPETHPERAFVLLQLARAADTRGHYTRAATAARMAHEAAHAAGKSEWARTAREMVAVLEGTQTEPAVLAQAFPDRRYVGTLAVSEAAEEDADAVLGVLLPALAPEPALRLPSPLRATLAAGAPARTHP